MIQGAGSNVGKSMIVAGLCRAFSSRGLKVLPFKPQNMSNNASVTSDGGEIGRAQAMQALACGVKPRIDMNPVLLKPESEVGAQVIVQGQRLTTVKARDYAKLKPTLMPRVMESFNRLADDADLIIIEGAGSPAETNLRDGDIANMGFAEAANVPVIWATQVLENLAKTGIPTRAEISDAAMSVNAECVMLNKGEFILDAVRNLKNILVKMEAHSFKKKNSLRVLNIAQKTLEKIDIQYTKTLV